MTDDDDLRSLPPEVAAEIAKAREAVMGRMQEFAAFVTEKRDEAVAARRASGIEATWTYCEEAYLGIDDLNRHEWEGARWAKWIKSPSDDGPLRRLHGDDDIMRATAYPRLTARYVDAGAAKMAEILLPIDGRAFALKPTPVPELSKALKDLTQYTRDGQPQMRPAKPEEMEQGGEGPQPGAPMAPPQQPQPGAAPGQPPGAPQGQPQGPPPQKMVPLTIKDLAEKQIELADTAAEEAGDLIHDWLTECRHPRTMRKAIFDGARLGTMVVKGPVPTRRTATVVRTKGGLTIERVTKTVPKTEWVPLWNCYPAPDCGEDVQAGSYFVESDELGEKALSDLRDQGGYIAWAIDRVLEEGPEKSNVRDDGRSTKPHEKGVFTTWTWWGVIKPKDLKLTNPGLYRKCKDDLSGPVYAMVTLVNDTPIKVALNPVKSGRFPHKVAVWRRRAGSWAGQGVAEQMKAPQAIMTGAVRGMLNNGGKSAGSQIVMDDEVIIPKDGKMTIYGDKVWIKAPDATIEDVRKAFSIFTIPNVTPQMLSIIEFAFRLAEESTSIPLITQGQSGDTTPDTFGATQLQNNNANQLLRDVGASVAEDLTEPLIADLYEWLLLDENVPDTAKGDLQVDVSGMLALVEQAVQEQTIMGLGNLLQNPAFGIDPRRWIKQYLRSKRLVPSEFQYSEAEQQQRDKAPPPKPPAVQAAEIRAQAQVATSQSRDQLAVKRIEVDTDRDTMHLKAQTDRTQIEYQAQMEKLALQERIAILNYATQERVSLQQAKVDLFETTAKLKLQRDLSGDDGKGPEVLTPAIEPQGRAPDGEAFQK